MNIKTSNFKKCFSFDVSNKFSSLREHTSQQLMYATYFLNHSQIQHFSKQQFRVYSLRNKIIFAF
jgi:hypothetical protein